MLKLQLNYKLFPILFIVIFFTISCNNTTKDSEIWSFAVMADPRSDGDTFRNALIEIRNMDFNPKQSFKHAEFIVVVGDIDPIASRYEDYQTVFINNENMKAFYPVMGNHDYDEEPEYIIENVLPEQPNIILRDAEYANYYVEWKNVCLVMVDAYSDLGFARGCINSMGKEWVNQIIETAPASIEHIFIFFHEPAFPRYAHFGDSFDYCPDERNAFWNMLVENKDRVHAVFVGHTHYYYRMQVFDPSEDCANDYNCFPDDPEGIYQVDAGAAGNGIRSTIVQVQIDGEKAYFRVIDAPDGGNETFNLKDQWNY